MSQPARVYRILIVAPYDVDRAREVVDRAILDWNNENFKNRRVVLLPLAWEPPEHGREPSATSILRREVAGGCDLCVGVFWTRLTSVPGADAMELMNELDQLKRSGTPVLLYFSKQRAHIDEIDPQELARLKDFRRQQNGGCTIEEFNDIIQFRQSFKHELDHQIRLLLSLEAGPGDTAHRRPVDLSISFADPSSGESTGEHLVLESKFFEIRNFEKIPDYARPDGGGTQPPSLWGMMFNQSNKDYYRNYIRYVFQGSILRPLRFVIQNTGLIGLRDVRVEIAVSSQGGSFFCLRPENRLKRPEKEVGLVEDTPGGNGIGFAVESFSTSHEIECIQPMRTLFPEAFLLLGAERDVTCTLDVTIYADALAAPLRRQLTIELRVARESVDALEFLEVLRDR
ncbi:hypothetical protein [Nibricoccus sp. IMCC34717]|uniref:hypothetical protein n=1 Tax=Nibricoccus sp. IMCC34717 TaxID=3034021 RepID=UPI00384C15F4